MFHFVHPRKSLTYFLLLFFRKLAFLSFPSILGFVSLQSHPSRLSVVKRIAVNTCYSTLKIGIPFLRLLLPPSASSLSHFLLAQIVLQSSSNSKSAQRATLNPLPLLYFPPHFESTAMFARTALRSTVAPLRLNKTTPITIRTLTTAPTTSYENILISSPAPGVSLVTLNRPKALNGEYSDLRQ